MLSLVSALLIAAAAPVAPSPVPASTLPAATQTALNRLFDAMHLADTFDTMVAQIVPLFTRPLASANPGRDADIGRIVTEEVTAAMLSRRATFVAVARETYGRHFTNAEIDGLTAFYRTPLGLKLLREQAPISKELGAIGAAIGREAGVQAGQRILARLKADNLAAPKSS